MRRCRRAPGSSSNSLWNLEFLLWSLVLVAALTYGTGIAFLVAGREDPIDCNFCYIEILFFGGLVWSSSFVKMSQGITLWSESFSCVGRRKQRSKRRSRGHVHSFWKPVIAHFARHKRGGRQGWLGLCAARVCGPCWSVLLALGASAIWYILNRTNIYECIG
jgi:hypothetical protein